MKIEENKNRKEHLNNKSGKSRPMIGGGIDNSHDPSYDLNFDFSPPPKKIEKKKRKELFI